MVVFVTVTVQDIHGQKFNVNIQNEAQVLGLKLQIWEIRSIAPEHQRLVFAGRQLTDDEDLATAGVQHGSVVFLVQQNEQTQATQAVVPAQQIATVPVVPVVQQPIVQPMNVAVQQPVQPQVVLPPAIPEDTCCFCVPLRTGALIILILSLISHLASIPIGLIGCIFVGLGGYGWYKRRPKFLMSWVVFQAVELFLSAIYGIVMLVIFEVVGFKHHSHHHHGHGHGYGHHGSSSSATSGGSTTTRAPHKITAEEKAIFGIMWGLGICVVVVVGLYYIRAVHRYVVQMRREEEGAPGAQQVVNGVVYQQV